MGSFLLLGALLAPGSLSAHGEGDAEMLEHFDEHLDHFAMEIEHLAAHVDAVVVAYREGGDADAKIGELIEKWEEVAVHEVIETKAVYLYPPIWQGIHAMKKAAEAPERLEAMKRGAERTKAAFWQGLGGLRVLAETPGAAAADAPAAGDAEEGGDFSQPADNEIELTGDDNMRFNETEFVVRAGEPVTLKFTNIGELPKEVMGHNVVVLREGTPVEPFGLAAAEAADNAFIPREAKHRENIIAHTDLLGPDESETITFTLEEPGAYPFVCSFTAHFRLMRGTIRAVADPAESPVAAILERLEAAAAAYEAKEAERAQGLVQKAYLNIFEGLEGDLIERDPELVSQLELDFNAGLPSLFQEDASMEEVRAQLEAMRERLQRAKKLLGEAEAERSEIF